MSQKPYFQVLKEIDELRNQGVEDSDPRMLQLRIQLRDHLEERNKNQPKKVVPKLTAVKTIKINPIALKKQSDQLGETKPEAKITNKYAKFYILGVVIAVVGLSIKFFLSRD
jgi:hypothetical protein